MARYRGYRFPKEIMRALCPVLFDVEPEFVPSRARGQAAPRIDVNRDIPWADGLYADRSQSGSHGPAHFPGRLVGGATMLGLPAELHAPSRVTAFGIFASLPSVSSWPVCDRRVRRSRQC